MRLLHLNRRGVAEYKESLADQNGDHNGRNCHHHDGLGNPHQVEKNAVSGPQSGVVIVGADVEVVRVQVEEAPGGTIDRQQEERPLVRITDTVLSPEAMVVHFVHTFHTIWAVDHPLELVVVTEKTFPQLDIFLFGGLVYLDPNILNTIVPPDHLDKTPDRHEGQEFQRPVAEYVCEVVVNVVVVKVLHREGAHDQYYNHEENNDICVDVAMMTMEVIVTLMRVVVSMIMVMVVIVVV